MTQENISQRVRALARETFGEMDQRQSASLMEFFAGNSLRVVELFLKLESEFGLNAEALIASLVATRQPESLLDFVVQEIQKLQEPRNASTLNGSRGSIVGD